jgi:hypothetical protein
VSSSLNKSFEAPSRGPALANPSKASVGNPDEGNFFAAFAEPNGVDECSQLLIGDLDGVAQRNRRLHQDGLSSEAQYEVDYGEMLRSWYEQRILAVALPTDSELPHGGERDLLKTSREHFGSFNACFGRRTEALQSERSASVAAQQPRYHDKALVQDATKARDGSIFAGAPKKCLQLRSLSTLRS